MRPRFFPAVLLTLLFVPAPLFAQTSGDSAEASSAAAPAPQTRHPAPPPRTASITGTVYCSDTRRPARGAVVMAQPVPKSVPVNVNFSPGLTRVGLDGTYIIRHLLPGDYTIVALLPGYLSPFDDFQVDQSDPKTEAAFRERLTRNGIVSVRNDETARMDVTLARGATISGRVLFDDGAPATQAILNLEDVNAKPATSQKVNPEMPEMNAGVLLRGVFLHQSLGTDDQGNFRISGIKPGTYRIAAMQPAESLGDGGEGFGIIMGITGNSKSLRIYSGDTIHMNTAKTYELHAGEEVSGVEITIPVYAFHRVEGHITTLDGRPILSAGLTLTDTSDDAFILHAIPAHDGGFVFPEVPSGTYKLAIGEARSGTLPENFSENYPDAAPIEPSVLQNVQSFADKTTTVLVKDADITDLNIQLQNAQPVPNQSSTALAPGGASPQ